MNKQRLLTLADHVRNVVPVDRFDMMFWSGYQEPFEGELDLHSCDSAACAVGWASTIPEFKELGFHLRSQDPFGVAAAIPSFKGSTGYFAVESFFEITRSQATYLFAYHHYQGSPSREEVADRIVKFVNEDGRFAY